MLEDTGERVVPEYMKPENGMWLEHLARYYFSFPYLKGRVLDIACGSGYGTKLIAKSKRKEITEAVGVDIDAETIQYAKGAHHHPKVSFMKEDALNPDLPDLLGSFDTILSFETIEHVPDDRKFLDQLVKLLRPGGTLVLSTPFGAGREEPSGSPFHFFQLTEAEFESLCTETRFGFSAIDFYYQLGVAFDHDKREGVHYPLGIAVCTK